jgi:hypothetical protein
MKLRDSSLYNKFRKVLDSYLSVIPIVLAVSVLYAVKVIPSLTTPSYIAFLIASFFIGFGLWLFSIGSESSISKIGTLFGSSLFKHRNLFFIGSMTFILGVMITIAEPDLKIMASQTGWNETLLIAFVSLGVGLFLLFGVLRIIFKKNLQVMFLAFYAMIFALAGLVNPKFLPLSFDSGAVVTGPLTIPFILSFGAAMAASQSSTGGSSENSFGLTALATAGPILSVMVLSLFVKTDSLTYDFTPSSLVIDQGWDAFFSSYGASLGSLCLKEAQDLALAIVPLAAFFAIYDLIFIRQNGKNRLKITIGFFYSFLGLWIFLVAVNLGFLPLAQNVGIALGKESSLYPLAILLGGLFGLFGVYAEPAVHVLVKQIEDVSEGAIKAKRMLFVMALSVGGGMALQVIRAHYGFSILYYFIPLYAAALALSFFVPTIYANIAFDSGSIASGPMAASFVMPFVVGFTYASAGKESVFTSAFGTIAMVSAMPLVVIQLMGLYAGIKTKILNKRIQAAFKEPDDCQVIHFS